MTFCWQQPKLVPDAVGKVLLWYRWVMSHWHPQRLHPCTWVVLRLVAVLVAPVEVINQMGQRSQICKDQQGSDWQCAGAYTTSIFCLPWRIQSVFF